MVYSIPKLNMAGGRKMKTFIVCFGSCCNHASPPRRARPPIAAPTPMPAFAPADNAASDAEVSASGGLSERNAWGDYYH